MSEKKIEYEKKYLVINKKTSRVQVDKDRVATLFTDTFPAKALKMKDDTIEIQNVSRFNFKRICSICYAAGATELKVVGEDEISTIRLNPNFVDRFYYNGNLNAYLYFQLENFDDNSLEKLNDCKFIVAIEINPRKENYISYACIKNHKKKNPLLAFSDLTEFERWRKRYGTQFKPLEVDFVSLYRLGYQRGYVVNVMSSKYYLPPGYLKKIKNTLREEELCLI